MFFHSPINLLILLRSTKAIIVITDLLEKRTILICYATSHNIVSQYFCIIQTTKISVLFTHENIETMLFEGNICQCVGGQIRHGSSNRSTVDDTGVY